MIAKFRNLQIVKEASAPTTFTHEVGKLLIPCTTFLCKRGVHFMKMSKLYYTMYNTTFLSKRGVHFKKLSMMISSYHSPSEREQTQMKWSAEN